MGSIIIDATLFLIVGSVLVLYIYEYINYRKYENSRSNNKDTTPAPIPETLELRRNHTNNSPYQQKKAIIIATLYFLLIFGSIILVFFVAPVIDAPESERAEVLNKLLSKLINGITSKPERIFLFIISLLMIPIAFLIPRYIQDEKLILDKQGISYYSPAPDFIKSLFPDWTIIWANIDQIILGNNMVIGTLVTRETEKNTKRRLVPATWKLKNKERAYNGLFIQTKENRRAMYDADYIMQSPMIKYINEYTHLNLTIDKKPNSVMSFDLAEQKETTIIFSCLVAILILTLIGFTSMSHMEIHAAIPSWLIYSPAFIIAIFSFLYLQSKKIPKPIIIALPLLMGIVSAFASYPTSLLVNRVTDTNGLHPYKYIKVNTKTFVSDTPDLPEIQIDRFEFGNTIFWDSFKNGDVFEFHLRKGTLGFYQIAMEPVHKKSRYWHCIQGVNNHGHDPKGCDDI